MILDSIMAVLGGGATGVIGSLATHVTDYFKQKEANKHELAMANLHIQERQMEFDQQTKVVSIEAEKDMNLSAEQSFQASYAADKASYGIWFVDFIRGLVRPALTVYLIVLANMILAKIVFLEAAMHAMNQDQIYTLVSDIINAIMYLTTTAVLWWFGSRTKKFKN